MIRTIPIPPDFVFIVSLLESGLLTPRASRRETRRPRGNIGVASRFVTRRRRQISDACDGSSADRWTVAPGIAYHPARARHQAGAVIHGPPQERFSRGVAEPLAARAGGEVRIRTPRRGALHAG